MSHYLLALQGNTEAHVKVGDLIYYGAAGSQPSEGESELIFLWPLSTTKASNNFNAQARFNMGYMHEKGEGQSRDLHIAKRYYDEAAKLSVDAEMPVTRPFGIRLMRAVHKLQSWSVFD